jgi:hypothetical protein
MTVKWHVKETPLGIRAYAEVDIQLNFLLGLRALHTMLQCGDRVRHPYGGIEGGTLMSPFKYSTKQYAVVVWDDGSAGLWRANDLRRE